jgi:hypothetical protein
LIPSSYLTITSNKNWHPTIIKYNKIQDTTTSIKAYAPEVQQSLTVTTDLDDYLDIRLIQQIQLHKTLENQHFNPIANKNPNRTVTYQQYRNRTILPIKLEYVPENIIKQNNIPKQYSDHNFITLIKNKSNAQKCTTAINFGSNTYLNYFKPQIYCNNKQYDINNKNSRKKLQYCTTTAKPITTLLPTYLPNVCEKTLHQLFGANKQFHLITIPTYQLTIQNTTRSNHILFSNYTYTKVSIQPQVSDSTSKIHRVYTNNITLQLKQIHTYNKIRIDQRNRPNITIELFITEIQNRRFRNHIQQSSNQYTRGKLNVITLALLNDNHNSLKLLPKTSLTTNPNQPPNESGTTTLRLSEFKKLFNKFNPVQSKKQTKLFEINIKVISNFNCYLNLSTLIQTCNKLFNTNHNNLLDPIVFKSILN